MSNWCSIQGLSRRYRNQVWLLVLLLSCFPHRCSFRPAHDNLQGSVGGVPCYTGQVGLTGLPASASSRRRVRWARMASTVGR